MALRSIPGGKSPMTGNAGHWLDGFQYNVEEWGENDHYDTLAICKGLDQAVALFDAEVARNPNRKLMVRNRMREVRKHPPGDW